MSPKLDNMSKTVHVGYSKNIISKTSGHHVYSTPMKFPASDTELTGEKDM